METDVAVPCQGGDRLRPITILHQAYTARDFRAGGDSYPEGKIDAALLETCALFTAYALLHLSTSRLNLRRDLDRVHSCLTNHEHQITKKEENCRVRVNGDWSYKHRRRERRWVFRESKVLSGRRGSHHNTPPA